MGHDVLHDVLHDFVQECSRPSSSIGAKKKPHNPFCLTERRVSQDPSRGGEQSDMLTLRPFVEHCGAQGSPGQMFACFACSNIFFLPSDPVTICGASSHHSTKLSKVLVSLQRNVKNASYSYIQRSPLVQAQAQKKSFTSTTFAWKLQYAELEGLSPSRLSTTCACRTLCSPGSMRPSRLSESKTSGFHTKDWWFSGIRKRNVNSITSRRGVGHATRDRQTGENIRRQAPTRQSSTGNNIW